ncbi:MAG: hypothetical protein V4478_03350 [Patescibacteria group bacterium]
MEKTEKKIKDGLLPLPADTRDYPHAMVFGALPLKALPSQDFAVMEPLGIKDQSATGDEDFCTAFSSCAVSEDQESVLLNPEYIFMKSKILSGDPEKWGQDLRAICKAHCKFGTIEQQYFPYLNNPQERDFYVDPKNWSEELDMLAFEHRKNSFFAVDGPHDTFDNFRMTLWQNKDQFQSIVTGANWKPSWTSAPGGIISETETAEEGSPHAFKIYGQKTIDGKMYLVAQLSNGIDIGDMGIFYFPRSVVNKEFVFGAFIFHDMPKDMAAYHAENGISVHDSLLKKFIKVINNIFISYFKSKLL